MKGRTTCPKCKHEFVLDLPDENKKHDVVCPKCNNKFSIQTKCPNPESDGECSWEEHGEPRKTILSKIKTKTNKPMIAAILLASVFALGMTTAVFSETYVVTTMDLASGLGMTGNVEILITDQSNDSIRDVSVSIDGLTGTTNEDGIYSVENVQLGILTLELSAPEFETQTREILVYPIFDTKVTIKMDEGDGTANKIEFDPSGCTLILVIFSIFALIGLIACLKRQNIDVAIAGSLISIFSFGFFFIGSILSIIAFVLIWKSKEEFEDGKKGKIF